MERSKLRNIAIIAHVDHGKTTLVDAMLQQTGVFRSGEAKKDRVMDSGDLERERGITILAKHASVEWKDYKINIIDTPGHADFGGEVERTLRMADGALLLVDAAEGPLPQTRFVLAKALELGLRIILVVNKIDRSDGDPEGTVDKTFELFCDLDATDEQADFPTIFAIGKDGVAKKDVADELVDLTPLFETIITEVPPPAGDVDAPLSILIHNTLHDDYVGKLAIGRVRSGKVSKQQQVSILGKAGTTKQAKVGKVWTFHKLERVETDGAEAGDILAISGIADVEIGDTIAQDDTVTPLARIEVDEPTIKMRFTINTSPFAGLSGKYVTSRQVRERLDKEVKRNIALRVEDTENPEVFTVFGRGELMLAILAETMRREGYELAVGMPEVVEKEIDGVRHEPYEIVVADVEDDHVGTITKSLGERRGILMGMQKVGAKRTRIEFRVPSRSLIGFRGIFLTETRGSGLLNTLFDGWEPASGSPVRRKNGALVADRKGQTTPYALFHLQPRGVLFIPPGTQVYEGMVIGEHNRDNDLVVNAVREKKLTNVRAAGKDENTIVSTPKTLTIESAIDWIDHDELVEITPDAVRVRKAVLQENRRPRRDR